MRSLIVSRSWLPSFCITRGAGIPNTRNQFDKVRLSANQLPLLPLLVWQQFPLPVASPLQHPRLLKDLLLHQQQEL